MNNKEKLFLLEMLDRLVFVEVAINLNRIDAAKNFISQDIAYLREVIHENANEIQLTRSEGGVKTQ